MRFLSIEVALGLCAIYVMACTVLSVEIRPTWFLVVPLACWAVYTIDRILDSRKPESTPDTGRHQFHVRHRTTLSALAGVALVISAATAVIDFPLHYWYTAVPLGGLTLLHSLLQRTHSTAMSIIKDLNVVLTYTVSAWALPIVDRFLEVDIFMHRGSPSPYWIAVYAAMLLLVLIDVILLSRIDADEDRKAGRPSIAVALGNTSSQSLVLFLTLIVLSLASTLLWGGLASVAILLFTMSFAYVLLLLRHPKDPDVARLVIESVLVLPLLLLMLK